MIDSPRAGGLTPRERWWLAALLAASVFTYALLHWGLALSPTLALWRSLRWLPFMAAVCFRGGRALAVFIVLYFLLMRWGLEYDSYGLTLVMMKCVGAIVVVHCVRRFWRWS